jgi:hypothetical protein
LMAWMETFKRGYIWRVGNGASIDVWSDPWLPNSPTRKVFTPRGRIVISKVEELINPSTGSWGIQLLEEIFTPVTHIESWRYHCHHGTQRTL